MRAFAVRSSASLRRSTTCPFRPLVTTWSHDQADPGLRREDPAWDLRAHLVGGAGTETAFWLLARNP